MFADIGKRAEDWRRSICGEGIPIDGEDREEGRGICV